MQQNETRLRVRYAETDQMGVVYYANYLIWMEVGRAEMCRANGIRYRDMERDAGILLAVAEANCRYRFPARYDEEVIIRTLMGASNPRMVRFDYEIESAESGRVLATGYTIHVFLNREMRPVKLPESFRPMFGM
jgi:acyl-CoA thioester hydrolase